jgi:hypothetical protein
MIELSNIDVNEDAQQIIDQEKEKTYNLMTRQKTKYKPGMFKETLIKAQRAYAGQHMKAVYTDSTSG